MTRTFALPARIAGLTLIALLVMIVAAAAQGDKIPQRSDIDAKYKWKLNDIYPDTISWNADFRYIENNYPKMENYKGTLGESSKQLAACLAYQDTLSMKLGALYVYAFMKYHEDTRVSFYQELQQRIAALDAQLGSATSFIEPEILTIPDDKLRAFMAENPDLKPYQFKINDMIRSKAHILSAGEESILALASPVAQGPENIYELTYTADVKFPTIVDDKGDSVRITRGRFSKMLESPDRDFRRRASEAYSNAYEPYFNTLGATLASAINTDWFYTQARKYDTCLEYKLDNNNIPVDVFNNLVNAVDANLEPLHKYIQMRKKVMELDEIHSYDLSVPLVPDMKKEILYDDAVQIILKGLKPLGDKYIKDMKKGFNSGWIDVYETEGKYTGGYSWGSYLTHPYILLNYNNSIEEMFTIAHEMGHSLHRDYSYAKQPYSTAFYTTFVAEVASTVNEALLINYLIDNAKSDEERLYYLTYYIEQIIGTFYTQVMFSEFEKQIHDVVEQGGALSAESMKQMYTDIYDKYWGSQLVKDDWGGWGGLRVSHFYTSYYVYQYATSYTAAQMISKEILAGDKKARDKYLEFLSWGGNDYPVEQLKKIGVDMTKPDAINATIDLFGNLVDRVEKIMLKDKKK